MEANQPNEVYAESDEASVLAYSQRGKISKKDESNKSTRVSFRALSSMGNNAFLPLHGNQRISDYDGGSMGGFESSPSTTTRKMTY